MLTRSQIAKASADAQIAFCLDKQPTYEVALAREIEAMMLSRIAELQETNALNNKVIDTQHRAMVNAEKRGVAKGIEESAERIAALEAKLAQRVPMASSVEEAARDVAKCLNERGGHGLDLRHVAMLVHHAHQADAPAWNALVSDREYLRLFDEARHGSTGGFGVLRGIRACIAAYEAATPAQQAEAQEPSKAVHQFRKAWCSDWYDGLPDHEDGGGPYETRTLFTRPQPAQLQRLSEEETMDAWRGVDDAGDDRRNAMLYGDAIQSALAAKNGSELK